MSIFGYRSTDDWRTTDEEVRERDEELKWDMRRTIFGNLPDKECRPSMRSKDSDGNDIGRFNCVNCNNICECHKRALRISQEKFEAYNRESKQQAQYNLEQMDRAWRRSRI